MNTSHYGATLLRLSLGTIMLAHAYLSATRATAEKGAPQPEASSSSR